MAEVSNQTSQKRQMKELRPIKIYSKILNLDYTVYVQDESCASQQRCHILTVHDIGCDHTSFQEFISCPEMAELKNRIIWIHVDLPGQEPNAADLTNSKYPSLQELAQELILVLNHFNLHEVTVLGEGAGANIASRFAIQYPNRCLGVCLIHPTGATATFFQVFKEKVSHLLEPSKSNHMNSGDEAYLIWHRYGHSNQNNGNQNDHLVQANIKEFQEKLYHNRNPKNLALFIESFLNRTNINEKLNELNVDVLLIVGKKASAEIECKKFYRTLYETHKADLKKLANSALLEVDDVADVIGETPDKLALALQFFLQGIGLLPAMPMKKELKGLGRLSRAFSMEDADKPHH